MEMKSMKREPKKAEESCEPAEALYGDKDQYSYGLRVNLGEEEIAKLGMKELPKAGAEMTIAAKVKVCDVGQSDTTEGVKRRLELQITDLGLE